MLGKATRGEGFSLIEVVVALAVVALALAALWQGLNQAIVVTQEVPQRITARWVAQNQLVLRQAREEWPPTRVFSHETTMGGRLWYIEERIEPSEEPLMRRVTVFVRLEKKGLILFTLEGYLARPRARGTS